MVLGNDVVFGSVNANRRHYEAAADALARGRSRLAGAADHPTRRRSRRWPTHSSGARVTSRRSSPSPPEPRPPRAETGGDPAQRAELARGPRHRPGMQPCRMRRFRATVPARHELRRGRGPPTAGPRRAGRLRCRPAGPSRRGWVGASGASVRAPWSSCRRQPGSSRGKRAASSATSALRTRTVPVLVADLPEGPLPGS